MRHRVLAGLVMVAVGLVGPLGAQSAPRISVALQASRTPGWSLREETGSFLNRQASYGPSTTFGLELGFAPIPLVQVYGSFDTNLGGFGDDSGYSLGEVGLAARPWRGWPVVPFGTTSYGRMSESGGVSFGFWTFGAGLELPLGRAVAVRGAARHLVPTDARTNRGGPGQTVTVDAAMTRLVFGLAFRF